MLGGKTPVLALRHLFATENANASLRPASVACVKGSAGTRGSSGRIHWPFQQGLLDDVNDFLSGALIQYALAISTQRRHEMDWVDASRWLRAVYRSEGRELPKLTSSAARGEVTKNSKTIATGTLRCLADILCKLSQEPSAREAVRKVISNESKKTLGHLKYFVQHGQRELHLAQQVLARGTASTPEEVKKAGAALQRLTGKCGRLANDFAGLEDALSDLLAIEMGQHRVLQPSPSLSLNGNVHQARNWSDKALARRNDMLHLAALILCIVRVAEDVQCMRRSLGTPSIRWYKRSRAHVLWAIFTANKGIILQPKLCNRLSDSPIPLPRFHSSENQWELVKKWLDNARAALAQKVVEELVVRGADREIATRTCLQAAETAIDLVTTQWLERSAEVNPSGSPFVPPT